MCVFGLRNSAYAFLDTTDIPPTLYIHTSHKISIEYPSVGLASLSQLPARTSEHGNVIGLMSIIYINATHLGKPANTRRYFLKNLLTKVKRYRLPFIRCIIRHYTRCGSDDIAT